MRSPHLTREAEADLVRRWRAGDERALERLIMAYQPLVKAQARRLAGYSVDIEDLISEGNVGLMKAAQGFELERGLRFSTYAAWWVRSQMQEYVLGNASMVTFSRSQAPRLLFFNLRNYRRAVAAECASTAEFHQRAAKTFGVSVALVQQMDQRLAMNDLSINAPCSDSDGEGFGEVGDNIVDPADTPEEAASAAIDASKVRAAIASAMRHLSTRERNVFKARKLADDPVTLDALGTRFGVSKERIRQIEAKAFRQVACSLDVHLAGAV